VAGRKILTPRRRKKRCKYRGKGRTQGVRRNTRKETVNLLNRAGSEYRGCGGGYIRNLAGVGEKKKLYYISTQ